MTKAIPEDYAPRHELKDCKNVASDSDHSKYYKFLCMCYSHNRQSRSFKMYIFSLVLLNLCSAKKSIF